ncbi:dihydroorotase [Methyloterricola oryzae]|uniref:dihydroorotase n=1 Tax=Methyloterricola oryzae TaxID=1495050 RepID=UPI0005EBD8C8|nr:dihydroorotase [Methyloterricola oryzae]
MQHITLIRPDDWHLHLRDGDALSTTVPHTARQFARAIVMPNLTPPVTTVEAALAYRQRILAAVPADLNFEPLTSLYLTPATTRDEVARAAECPHVHAFKLYPAGATTHSEAGVGDLKGIYPVLEAMEHLRVPLLVHGEVTDPGTDIFDRERLFIERELAPMAERFPGLRLVLEHVTTREGIDFVRSRPQLAGTLTAHHLLYNRNALLAGGVRPHYFCLPVLKRETHRQALLEAATSGNPQFFLGTDSAPHAQSRKETACGCAGCYTAHAAMELYAEAFDSVGRLHRLESFASLNGPRFYGLEPNRGTVTLTRQAWTAPETYPLGSESLVPLRAGESIAWKLA